jgi:amino acid transporter
VLAFSREGFLPRYFSNVNAKTRVPARGVFFVGVLIMLGVTVGKKIEDYADMAVISFMVIGVMQGYAAYRLPRIHPDVHQASEFKYSPLLHDLLTLGSIVIAVGILVLYIWKGWEMLAIFLAWVAAGSIFYVVRRRQAELNLSSEG